MWVRASDLLGLSSVVCGANLMFHLIKISGLCVSGTEILACACVRSGKAFF